MNSSTMPTIQDIMDKARLYREQGLEPDEAIRRAIAVISLPDWQGNVKPQVQQTT